MKKFGSAIAVAGGLTAAVIGLAAPAGAAPSGAGNAQQTVSKLESEGYTVIVNHLGGIPFDQAQSSPYVRVRRIPAQTQATPVTIGSQWSPIRPCTST